MSLVLLEEYIQSGNTVALTELLRNNPKLAQQPTSHQVSPLMLSCYYKKPETTKILLDHLPDITIFEAASINKLDIVAKHLHENPELINDFSEDGFTALGLASYFGNEDVTRYLLLNGADVNLPSKNGYSVYPIHSAVADNHSMIVKMLLEAGANVNVRQMSGITPLHSAAQNGNIELIILLLEAGADVQAEMEGHKTPAQLAAEKGYEELAKILV